MATAAMRAGSRLTLEELHALPEDGNRYELIDGELFVTPAPTLRHQDAAASLYVLLRSFARASGCDAYLAPADITFATHTLVQPDLFILPRREDGSRAGQFEDVGRLLLAVEVISPSSRRTDRNQKRRLYQREGVPVYWIVDQEQRMVEVWGPDGEACRVERESLELDLPGAAAPLVITLPAFFDSLLDS
jgi:Uma2 family endonuclease